jgi:hypothetical protein
MSLETELEADPKDFAKQYAFLPRDRATGFLFSSGSTESAMTGTYKGFQHAVIKDTSKIARVKLELSHAGSRGEAVQVIPSLNSTDGIPVYFLPWNEKGAAVGMTIPELPADTPVDQHPKLFFTAVLSGCMIAFKGTVRKPVIYHCGTAGGEVGQGTIGDSNDFFSDLLDKARQLGLTTGPVQTKIKSTDYMVTRAGVGTTTLEKNLVDDMKTRWGQRVIVKEVKSWGVCFGVRNGTDWKFYQQENASIQYYRFFDVLEDVKYKEKHWYGSKTKTIQSTSRQSEFLSVAKPITVTRVFPGGGVAKVTNYWTLLKT